MSLVAYTELTAEQIQENWSRHLKIINTFISEPRRKKVLKMVKDLEETLVMAPASGYKHFHNAFLGGYIDHVNRVVEASVKVKDLWGSVPGVVDFTDEELIFSALFHDLGKVGVKGKPNYLPEDDTWWRTKRERLFKTNSDLDNMLIQDRSLFVLQSYEIPITQKEWLGIKLHDGMYDEVNKPYYQTFKPEAKLKTTLPYILHQADMLASKIEYLAQN